MVHMSKCPWERQGTLVLLVCVVPNKTIWQTSAGKHHYDNAGMLTSCNLHHKATLKLMLMEKLWRFSFIASITFFLHVLLFMISLIHPALCLPLSSLCQLHILCLGIIIGFCPPCSSFSISSSQYGQQHPAVGHPAYSEIKSVLR